MAQDSRFRARHAALALAALCVARHAAGQSTRVTRPAQLATCGRDSTGLGRISGRFVADSAGIVTGNLRVVAWQDHATLACIASSDDAGNFTISGLPPREYVVTTGAGGYSALYPATPYRAQWQRTRTDIRIR